MIFVTGGAGYIGTHTCVELLASGHQVAVFDNFCNSQREAVARVERITGSKVQLFEGDIRDRSAVAAALRACGATAVVHFAGLKSVGESVAQPMQYHDNNVVGTLRLLEAMDECGVKTLVFSSSATVYGNPQTLPITEAAPLSATNPYGRTKLVIEDMLRDLYRSDPAWRMALLRYFNPVGAHPSGLVGEDPSGIPNNLLPFVAQVAVGRRTHLRVMGNDYDTPDGTGVRDYIHVMDLASGHVKALRYLDGGPGCVAINLGTGRGHSVLEMVVAFEQASGRPVPYHVVSRRDGDIAACYADASLAANLLGWSAERDLAAMCADAWRWQMNNPNGYSGDK